MEVLHTEETVTHAVIGGNEAQGFGIAATPEFVQMLSSSLYTDQIMAVVRETLCNAWDSHIFSGKTDLPIEITLNDESFTIRDFGGGIPHEKLNDIYCVYGASTKVKDANQTGGFGLGCKSPFAYADNFVVENFHNETMTKNLMVRSSGEANGMPGMTEIVRFPTTESGIRVTIPMKTVDVHRFDAYIKDVLFFGGIHAKYNGFVRETIDYDNAENNFVIAPTPNRDGNIFVKYGNVIYPIPDHDELNYKKREISKFIREIGNNLGRDMCFIAIAEPNSVNVAPSREQLTIQGRTLSTLLGILESFQAFNKVSERKVENILNDALYKMTKEEFNKINDYTHIGDCVSSKSINPILYRTRDLPWALAKVNKSRILLNSSLTKTYLRAYKKYNGFPYYLKMLINECGEDLRTFSEAMRKDIIRMFGEPKYFDKKTGSRPDLYFYGSFIRGYASSFANKSKSLFEKNLFNRYSCCMELDWVLRPKLVICHNKTSLPKRLTHIQGEWDNCLVWCLPREKITSPNIETKLRKFKQKGWEILDLRKVHPDEPVKKKPEKKKAASSSGVPAEGLILLRHINNNSIKSLDDLDKSPDHNIRSNTAKFVVQLDEDNGRYVSKSSWSLNKLVDAFGDNIVGVKYKRDMDIYCKRNKAKSLTGYLEKTIRDSLSNPDSDLYRIISLSPSILNGSTDIDDTIIGKTRELLESRKVWDKLGLKEPSYADKALMQVATDYRAYMIHDEIPILNLMERLVKPDPKFVSLAQKISSSPISPLIDFASLSEYLDKEGDDATKDQAEGILSFILESDK